jgi:predicted lipoprotein
MRRALVVLAVLPLTACGAAQTSSNTKFQGEQGKVAQVVDDLAAAGSGHHPDRICADILSKEIVAELKTAGGDCESEMKAAIEDASDFDLTVQSVKVNGNAATAEVRQGKDGKVTTFSFVKENGAWRASQLGT